VKLPLWFLCERRRRVEARLREHHYADPWPPYVDRLFRAVGAIVESEAILLALTDFAASVPHNAWGLNASEEVVERFKELQAAYDGVLLIDSPDKASAVAARLLKVVSPQETEARPQGLRDKQLGQTAHESPKSNCQAGA